MLVGLIQALTGCVVSGGGTFHLMAPGGGPVHAREASRLLSGGGDATAETLARPDRPGTHDGDPSPPISAGTPAAPAWHDLGPASEATLPAGGWSAGNEFGESGGSATSKRDLSRRPGVVAGTEPWSERLAIPARDNPDAVDLLDRWGHRHVGSIVDGLSLDAPDTEADAADLRALVAATRGGRGGHDGPAP